MIVETDAGDLVSAVVVLVLAPGVPETIPDISKGIGATVN